MLPGTGRRKGGRAADAKRGGPRPAPDESSLGVGLIDQVFIGVVARDPNDDHSVRLRGQPLTEVLQHLLGVPVGVDERDVKVQVPRCSRSAVLQHGSVGLAGAAARVEPDLEAFRLLAGVDAEGHGREQDERNQQQSNRAIL